MSTDYFYSICCNIIKKTTYKYQQVNVYTKAEPTHFSFKTLHHGTTYVYFELNQQPLTIANLVVVSVDVEVLARVLHGVHVPAEGERVGEVLRSLVQQSLQPLLVVERVPVFIFKYLFGFRYEVAYSEALMKGDYH